MQTSRNETIYKNEQQPLPAALMNNENGSESGDAGATDGHRDGDVVLRDGSTLRVRPMRAEDHEALYQLFQSLSEESRWLRFLSVANGSALAADARREIHLDDTFGLIALR